MGMFGTRAAAPTPYDAPHHSLGAEILNFLGTNLLGRDFLRDRDRADAIARIQRANQDAAGLFQPVPGGQVQVPVQNGEGADITDAFGPQMAQGPSRMRSPDEIASGLAQLSTIPGFDPTKFKDLAIYAKPDVEIDAQSGQAYEKHDRNVPGLRFARPANINGWVVDQGDPRVRGSYFPQLPNGVIPSGNGGVANASGLTAALSDQEQAQTTGRSMGTVFPQQNGDGSTSLTLGRDFLPGSGLRPTGAPGAPAAPVRGGNRSLTPGQETAQRADYTAGAQTIAGAGDATIKAQGTSQQYQQAFNDVLSLDPNNLTGFKLGTAKILRSLGVNNPNLEQFTNTAEGYRMLTTQMVLPLAKELGSNPSNRDAKIIQDSMPGLRTPRQTAAVSFAMAAATHNKEAARQQFFGGWTGDQSKAAMTRAWSATPDSQRSIFQDPIFQRLNLDGHPAVVFKQSGGKRYGIFHPYNADGSVNKNAQVFETH